MITFLFTLEPIFKCDYLECTKEIQESDPLFKRWFSGEQRKSFFGHDMTHHFCPKHCNKADYINKS